MLSVICPIYNEEKYIGQCVESILAQDYPKDDLEILFVDGMSTDDTRCIVVNYSNEYPFIKLFDNPKRDSTLRHEYRHKGIEGGYYYPFGCPR